MWSGNARGYVGTLKERLNERLSGRPITSRTSTIMGPQRISVIRFGTTSGKFRLSHAFRSSNGAPELNLDAPASQSNSSVSAQLHLDSVARNETKSSFKRSAAGWRENFLAGALASLISKAFLHPLDISKTILQASRKVTGRYSNLPQCMVGLLKERGIEGFYSGFLESLAVSIPSSAVFVASYELSKKALVSYLPQALLQCTPALAASFSNVVASVVRVPPEVVKQRIQVGLHRNIIEAAKSVWIKDGLAGFYCGYSSMVMRDIPYAALQFMTFELLKKRSDEYQRGLTSKFDERQRLLSELCMGAIAGAVASIITNPLDVVKTRIMTQGFLERKNSMGFCPTIKNIWLEEGIAGFGHGIVPRALYKVPASALFLVCYEAMKRIFCAAHGVH